MEGEDWTRQDAAKAFCPNCRHYIGDGNRAFGNFITRRSPQSPDDEGEVIPCPSCSANLERDRPDEPWRLDPTMPQP